jgi:hypothetical protein
MAETLDTHLQPRNLRLHLMQRSPQPELLDALPPDHPEALHFRRDLRITNQLMGNHRWIERVLPPLIARGLPVLEIGAGTGELARRLHRHGLAVDGLDLWPQPEPWPADRRWHCADITTFGRYRDYPVVIGNMIFHQFDDAALAALGRRIADSAHVIVACEPSRRRTSQVFYRFIAPLIGANRISRHDAHVSIGAGFEGDELPRALGLAAGLWQWRCTMTSRGAYHFVATRRP